MTAFNQSGQTVGHQVNVGRNEADFVEVDAEYMAWLKQLHDIVQRLTRTLPDSWRGWDPTNEQMRLLSVVKDMIAEGWKA